MLKYTLVFLLGFLSCAFLFYGFYFSGVEIPFGGGDSDSVAPSDWVDSDDIIVFGDKIILNIPNATVSNYAATGSMKPLFDSGANGIRVVPASEDDVEVGDIVSFRWNGMLVVHRVVEKGVDESGAYFVTKGDNNVYGDERIRFGDIEYVTVAIVY